ncbi:MAG: hypothetical protein M3N31_01305, partial [Actinomycetota bacterium]|nr:hypothetical protein [Actinomycetota bacterium]
MTSGGARLRSFPRPGDRSLSALFAVTLSLGSALLFAVEPMFAKMVLPTLGGTPAVWVTCMLFFQAALLAGYGYAHWSVERLGARRQACVHVVVLLLPLLVLPVAVPRGWGSPVHSPVWWLLAALAVGVGLPFFAVATNAPLLQRWFSGTAHPLGPDPYFLYRSSNVGSVVALLAYPALVEPNLPLPLQGRLWSAGYGVLVVLVVTCAVALWRSPARHGGGGGAGTAPGQQTVDGVPDDTGALATRPLTMRRRLRWVALAFVPSSLMLAVTTYLTTDIAPVPLLWVVPLALYLLTFVAAFSRAPLHWFGLVVVVQPLLLLQLLFLFLVGVTEPVGLLMALNLVTLFVSGLVCHGQLARDRPAARHLTEFYLWMAVGGALGGLFNGVVAPVVFDSVVEYPIAVVAACFLRPPPDQAGADGRRRRLDVDLPLALGTAAMAALWLARMAGAEQVTARAVVFGVA